MPRPRNNYLFALYKCNDSKQVVCYNEKCDGKVLYKHSANLERHLKLLHPSIYCSYMQKKKIRKFPRRANFEKRLIDLVRVYPILWNKLEKYSFNEESTNKTWKEISRKMEKSVKMCKMKWNDLIEKFKSELIEVPQPPPDAENVECSTCKSKSNWKYFPELLFLRDHIDFTKCATSVTLTSVEIETNKRDFIKEESSESFTLYNNEILENSNHLDYADKSILQDDTEETRLINEILESRPQDEKEASESQVQFDSEMSKIANSTEINMNQSKGSPTLDDTDDEDERRKTKKQKTPALILKTENGDMNIQDSDGMFLLSLLPYLKAIPQRKRLFVRHRIQGVLLEEQQNS